MKVLIRFVLGYSHKFCGFVITYSKMSHLSLFLTSLTLHFFSPYIILIGNVLQLKYLERKNDFLNTTVTSRQQKRKYCTWTVSFWCAIVWTVIFFCDRPDVTALFKCFSYYMTDILDIIGGLLLSIHSLFRVYFQPIMIV